VQTLPDLINTVADLERTLALPSDADVAMLARQPGDILIVGAGGKMGPSLARRIRAAADRAGRRRRVIAASRFSSASGRDELEIAGVETVVCDLTDRPQIDALPSCDHVLYLAGRKFGTTDRSDLTWFTNTVIPGRVAERFALSRLVVFSTGNVYPLVPAASTGSSEADAPMPVGEYAQSCLGRERVVEFVSRERGTPCLLFRLNYAVDLRYGTLVDIAHRVTKGLEVDLTVGWLNAIWQGDANSYALRSLELCASPPAVLNVTGSERISVREVATFFGRALGREVRFKGTEGPIALLSDASKCMDLLGPPEVSLDRLLSWIVHWVRVGGASLDKPTHFEVADGRF
jgi:nucleoside-diphosphate-sugar epimerase